MHTLKYPTLDIVEVVDLRVVLLEDVVPLEFQRRAQLAAGHGKVNGDDAPLLHPLQVTFTTNLNFPPIFTCGEAEEVYKRLFSYCILIFESTNSLTRS